jgi:hypothetical protein
MGAPSDDNRQTSHDGLKSEASPDSSRLSRASNTAPGPAWFLVGEAKLFTLSVCTLGLYQVFWFDRQWRYARLRSDERILPLARAIFAPLWCFSLFRRILGSVEAPDAGELTRRGWALAATFFALCACSRLPRPFFWVGLLSVLPVLIVQRAVNAAALKPGQRVNMNRRLTLPNWLAIAAGATVTVLAIVDTLAKPEDMSSQVFLSRIAEDANRDLPRKLNAETEFLSVEGKAQLLIYHYVLTNADGSQIDRSQFKAEMRPQLVRGACEYGATRTLLDHGVTLRYDYKNRLNVDSISIDISRSDCVASLIR